MRLCETLHVPCHIGMANSAASSDLTFRSLMLAIAQPTITSGGGQWFYKAEVFAFI